MSISIYWFVFPGPGKNPGIRNFYNSTYKCFFRPHVIAVILKIRLYFTSFITWLYTVSNRLTSKRLKLEQEQSGKKCFPQKCRILHVCHMVIDNSTSVLMFFTGLGYQCRVIMRVLRSDNHNALLWGLMNANTLYNDDSIWFWGFKHGFLFLRLPVDRLWHHTILWR